MITKFEIGKEYSTRSICDHDCIITETIVKRTAKSVTTEKGKRFMVKVWEGVEYIMPWGRYSMSPILRAE